MIWGQSILGRCAVAKTEIAHLRRCQLVAYFGCLEGALKYLIGKGLLFHDTSVSCRTPNWETLGTL
jgi:hypothetical protein